MSDLGPIWRAAESLPEHVHPGILRANILVRRLEAVVMRIGHEISENVYRRARDELLHGNQNFLATDEDIAAMLKRGPAGWGATTTAAAGRHPDIGLPEDPRELHRVWSGLSKSEKDDLYRADPYLGNRDGIPHEERDEYNRNTLDRLWNRARENGDYERQGNYDEITSMLYRTKRGDPELYLSYIDDDWHFAFSLDNPDRVDHAAVLLNPAGTKFPVGYAEQTLHQVRDAALAVDPSARTSVTLWGGYDNPRSMVHSIFPQFAADGAAAARRFHEGLRITHEGGGAHTSTIGHSYGGVLAGHAAGRGGALATDELVLVGSWGTGADHVTDLRLAGIAPERNAEHVYATMAPHDHVQLMPRTHGTAPTEPDFGATTFTSSSAPGSVTWNAEEHQATHYLDSANPASENIGLIVTGRGDMVT